MTLRAYKLSFQPSNSIDTQVSLILFYPTLILDTYISMVSYSHLICAKGIYVVSISTTIETANPMEEIQPAINLLGPILDMFVSESTLFDPLEDGKASNLWISKSYDPSSHFEVASNDILEIYEKIVGEKLDLNIEPSDDDEEY
jgi:Rab GDP dissociation inhibitor